MFEKTIVYFGQPTTVKCDAKCDKAWGWCNRPKVYIKDEHEYPDDFYMLADNELGIAPIDPGTYEGNDGKPVNASSGSDLNRWCVRECERCVFGDKPLRDFSKRFYN